MGCRGLDRVLKATQVVGEGGGGGKGGGESHLLTQSELFLLPPKVGKMGPLRAAN